MASIKEDLIKKYVYFIKTLETKISMLNRKDSNYKGYTINLDDYLKLKKIIDYEKNKNKISIQKFDIKYSEKIMTIKELEFRTSQYLINMLLNGNKYLIVDSTFWKVICEKGEENFCPINYEITNYIRRI